MKLHPNQPTAQNMFTASGDGFVAVNGNRIGYSVIVTGNAVGAWNVRDTKSLCADDLQRLLDFSPELILIGSGKTFRFPPAVVLRPLVDAKIGHEVMDTAAACRTYNILLGEGRNVLAALIVESIR